MSDSEINQQAPPVFLIGIMMRSGTNYLADVLQVIDPELCMPRVLDEDFLLVHSDLLVDYTQRMQQKWMKLPWVANAETLQSTLLREIGNGLLRVLREGVEPGKAFAGKDAERDQRRQVLWSFPSCTTVDPYERRARRGSVCGCFVRLRAIRLVGARMGPRCKLHPRAHVGASQTRGSTWEIVRYEDLVRGSPIDVLRSVVDVLDVPCNRVEWRRLPELPVRGSSQALDANGRLDWSSHRRVKDFSPIGRWSE